jgi:hypothetical protein
MALALAAMLAAWRNCPAGLVALGFASNLALLLFAALPLALTALVVALRDGCANAELAARSFAANAHAGGGGGGAGGAGALLLAADYYFGDAAEGARVGAEQALGAALDVAGLKARVNSSVAEALAATAAYTFRPKARRAAGSGGWGVPRRGRALQAVVAFHFCPAQHRWNGNLTRSAGVPSSSPLPQMPLPSVAIAQCGDCQTQTPRPQPRTRPSAPGDGNPRWRPAPSGRAVGGHGRSHGPPQLHTGAGVGSRGAARPLFLPGVQPAVPSSSRGGGGGPRLGCSGRTASTTTRGRVSPAASQPSVHAPPRVSLARHLTRPYPPPAAQVRPLYERAKGVLCCTLARVALDQWVATLAFAFLAWLCGACGLAVLHLLDGIAAGCCGCECLRKSDYEPGPSPAAPRPGRRGPLQGGEGLALPARLDSLDAAVVAQVTIGPGGGLGSKAGSFVVPAAAARYGPAGASFALGAAGGPPRTPPPERPASAPAYPGVDAAAPPVPAAAAAAAAGPNSPRHYPDLSGLLPAASQPPRGQGQAHAAPYSPVWVPAAAPPAAARHGHRLPYAEARAALFSTAQPSAPPAPPPGWEQP